jgi:hypothetical protein
MTNNKPFLQQAHDLIHGQRADDYGDALENFTHIAMGFSFVIAKKLTAPITAEEVALMMQTLKMARLSNQPEHFDSSLDTAGYQGCYNKIQVSRKAGKAMRGILK